MKLHYGFIIVFLFSDCIAFFSHRNELAIWLILVYALYCLSCGVGTLLDIRQILFDQTALMVEEGDDDEEQFDHPPFPIEADD
jgi:hypothetical protein